MAGVTDKAARQIAKPFGPGLMYTEMVSGKALLYNNQKTAFMLDSSPEEQPIAAQLFGHEPNVLAEIAYKAQEAGAKIIDINMGCPAPKIVNNGDGSAIMKNPYLAGEIVRAVVGASSVPVTVKIRKGWDDASVNAVEVAKIAEEGGASAITVHGRTRSEFYSGKADLDIIKAVKEAVKIPAIGNGDITDEESAKNMLSYTNCDGIMIGRGSEGNPWIFREVIHFLETGKKIPKPTSEERKEIMLKHLDLLVLYKGEHRGILESRKQMAWYIKGIQEGARLREEIFRASTLDEMKKIIDRIL
jgi:nifR3 family TIM-barrel protein